MNKVIKTKPDYNEIKATQAAALLLELNGGKMNYMKLNKLLYNIDREALNRWFRPVTGDDFFALPHGMILSNLLDKSKQTVFLKKTYWNRHIRKDGNNNNKLIKSCDADELSPAEINLIKEFDIIYKDKSQWDMEDEHNNKDLFPEWENPKGGNIPKDFTDALKAQSFSEEEIEQIASEIEQIALLEAMS